MTQNTNLSGIPSGFSDLDRMTGGWRPGELIMIASRPSIGKTAFMTSMARNMAIDYGYGVALFLLEMSGQQLVKRMIVSETEVDSDKIRADKLEPCEWKQIDVKIGKLTEAPIFIDDTAALSDFEFRDKCKRLVQQHGIHIAIIDYFQLMSWTGERRKVWRRDQLSDILCSLKATAQELNIPVIVLAALNRPVGHCLEDIRPQLADLRKLGVEDVIQNADVVAFIHCPEYYGFTEDEQCNSLSGVVEIIVVKNCNGAPGDVRLTFNKPFVKFSDSIL
jgi:replicative DNA helicase